MAAVGHIFVCLLVFIATVECACPDGWYRSGDYCYWLSTQIGSFQDAQRTCYLRESNLVSLSTQQDLNATMTVVSSVPSVQQAWTGLWFDPSIQLWTYLDNSPYRFNMTPWWNGQEPNPGGTNGGGSGSAQYSSTTEACATLDTRAGKLHRSSCTDQAAAFCRRSAYHRDQCDRQNGWTAIGTACCKPFTDTQSWFDAYATCSSQSASLLPVPFTGALWTVIQQLVTCDTEQNNVWIDTNLTASTNVPTQCNYVSVLNGPVTVQDQCLQEKKFICTKPAGTCGAGFFNHEGRCYFDSGTLATNWVDAKTTCESKGAQLIIVSDATEEQWLESMMQAKVGTAADMKMWIGLSDLLDAEGNIKWVDKTPVSPNVSYWASDGNNTDIFDCAVIKAQVGSAARWAMDYCFRKHPYMCEMSMTDDVLINKTNVYACDSGWTSGADKCYRLFDNKTFDEGRLLCAGFGGTLATLHSPSDQASVAALMPAVSFAWIGLRKDAMSNNFVWIDDGYPPAMTNWLTGEPNHVGSGEDCVDVVGAAYQDYAGAWNDYDCNSRIDCICQKNANYVTVTPTPASNRPVWSPRCGEGWLFSSTLSACYRLVKDALVPWSAAREQCRRNNDGGDLVSITHGREQAQIEAMMASAGLTTSGHAGGGVWLGANDYSIEGGWTWSDGAPFRYLHWRDGQPDNRGVRGEEQDCVVAVPSDSLRWDDRSCGERHPYICKKPALPETTAPSATGQTPSPLGPCKGWALLSGDSYSVTDSQLMASSTLDTNRHGPAKSRIYPGNTASWQSAVGETAPWIEVVFETLVTVRGVTTTGGLDQKAWVSQYSIRYRYDYDSPLYWYTETPGSSFTIFNGNNDSTTQVTNTLSVPFAARQVYLYPAQWSGNVATLRWELLGCLEDQCHPEYAVSGPLVVPDANITASSVSDPQHDTFASRLRGLSAGWVPSCWRPASADTQQWIQVDFERMEVLRGVTTRGNPQAQEWVISYILLYQPQDGLLSSSFMPYEEPYGTVMVFTGNSDSTSEQTNMLKSHVPTRSARIQPQAWNGYIAMTFDILVCNAGCQEQPLLGAVSDERLTATSFRSNHGAATSRINTSSRDGGWEALFNLSNQYIQVSLDAPLEVRAVATQGRQASNSWVTSYYLTWSADAKTWTNYSDSSNSTTMMFSGNFDSNSIHKHYLPIPVIARYVRLHPVTWQGSIALRWEIYGCPGKNSIMALGCYTDNPDDRDLPYEPYTDPIDGMDPLLCSRHCFNKGYFYAGIQDPGQCFCGNSYGRYGVSADCSIQCFPRREYLCGGFNDNSIYSTGLTAGLKVCPAGWSEMDEQCYSYNSSPLDWASARAACFAVNATLASVSGSNVNSLLYSLVGAAPNHTLAWTGLNDQREQRYYVWDNGEEVVYTNWDLRQPPPLVSGETSRCVAINGQTGGWMVADCSRRLPYVCRGAKRTATTPPTIATPTGCQQGMLAFLSSCYVLTAENITKDAADDVCATFNGNLVVIDDRLEQAYVTSLLTSPQGMYWTGVSDVHDPGRFTFSQGSRDVTYTNWAPYMPDSFRQGHCVAMGTGSTAGLWSNVRCFASAKALCEIPREGFPHAPVTPNPQHQNCSVNWVDGNSTLCYQINNVGTHLQRSWAEARADCRDQRAELASFPNTALLQDFWRRKLLGSSNHFWIGLYANPTGVMAWSDSSVLNVDGPWSPGQPDTINGTATCVELHVTSGTLSLQDCSLQRNWLCGIQQGVLPAQRLQDRAPTAGPSGSCLPLDDTWKRYGESCFTVYNTDSSWRQARATCQASGAELASIVNIQENLFVISLAMKTYQPSVWIGLNELQSDAGYYGWSDGRQVSFVNWAGQGPDDANGQESCVEMFVNTGKWNDQHCSSAQGFVCKRNVNPMAQTTPATTLTPQGGCMDGFVVYGDRCYIVLGQQGAKTWQQAADDCKARSTPWIRVQLASVRSHQDNAFLNTQLLNTNMLAWIGLRLINQTFLWLDNQDLTYTNWDTGEPNGGQRETCVHMYSRGANAGRWNDLDCSRTMGYICESNRYQDAAIPTTPASNCASGFERLGSSCYLYRATEMPWDQAEAFCVSQHTHLASVESQTEQDEVYLMVIRNTMLSSPSAWLGLKATQVGGQETRWTWTDGWPVTYSRWSVGGGLGSNSTDHCVSMDGNGTWTTRVCSENRPFVCKTTTDKIPYSQAPGTGTCDGGREWTPFGDRCYSFHLDDRVSFARADFGCSQRGAALASIHDNATNALVQAQVKAGSPVPAWIGFRRSDAEGFAWRDGTAVDFTNWAPNYPRGNTSNGLPLRCAQLSPWTGQWVDEECMAGAGYVCVKTKVYPPSTAVATGTTNNRPNTTPHPPTTNAPATRPPNTPVHTTQQTPSVTTRPPVTTQTSRPVTSTPAHVTASATTTTFGTTTNGGQFAGQGGGDNGGSDSGAIAGGVVGGVVVLALVVVALVWYIRRHRQQSHAGFTNVLYKNTAQEVHIDSQRQRVESTDELAMP